MYKCEICKRTVGPCIPENQIPSYRSSVTKYPARIYTVKKQEVRDNGGKGREIAHMVVVCPFCDHQGDPEMQSVLAKTYMRDEKTVVPRSVLEDMPSEQ